MVHHSQKYEEALRNIDDPSGTHHQAKACVTAVYLSTRMEAVRNSKPRDMGIDKFRISRNRLGGKEMKG